MAKAEPTEGVVSGAETPDTREEHAARAARIIEIFDKEFEPHKKIGIRLNKVSGRISEEVEHILNERYPSIIFERNNRLIHVKFHLSNGAVIEVSYAPS
jgi:hypothetical protein